jgi:hypothetical protein
MNTTESTSTIEEIKSELPLKVQFLFWLKDKGLTFLVMGMCMWVMYTWVDQSRIERMQQVKEQNEQIKDLRRIVDDCASAKRDRLELDVQAINIKVDKILTRQNIN